MVSDKKLLSDLVQFSNEIDDSPSASQMENNGPWSESTYRRHFGSWNDALRKADIEVNNEYERVSDEKLLDELVEFAESIGRVPTSSEMRRRGPRVDSLYIKRFGSWNNALEQAGFEPNYERVSDEKLLDELVEFAESIGRTPSSRKMLEDGPRSSITYQNRFGGWNKALQKAGLDINRKSVSERAGIGDGAYGRGYLDARRETFRRDGFKCRICGNGEEIHCHHITPRRKFDDVSNSNTVDNLITLCPSCHSTFEGRWESMNPEKFERKAKEFYG